MTNEIDKLIKEIAVRHGVAVGRDDPILILQTINARLLEQSSLAQSKLLDQFKSESEAIFKRWEFGANEKAERVLAAALTAAKTAMVNTMETGAVQINEKLSSETDSAIKALKGPIKRSATISACNIAASLITLASVAWLALSAAG